MMALAMLGLLVLVALILHRGRYGQPVHRPVSKPAHLSYTAIRPPPRPPEVG